MINFKRILLIDDSKSTSLINKALISENYDVEQIDVVESGEAGINYLKGGFHKGEPPKPELIFLDLEMPGSDGFEFLDKYVDLSEEVTNKFKTVLVILSNHLDYENFTKSKDYKLYGVLNHFKKPLDQEDLINILEEHFENP